MRSFRNILIALVACVAAPSWAASLSDDLLERMSEADVVLLGEIHDNPAHHETQRAALAALQPKAVVWEMLTGVQAGRIGAQLINRPEEMARILDWAESGWPAFAMYYPLFKAVPGARIYGGAVPREAAMAAMQAGEAVAFGADAARYGLTVDLPPAEMAERVELQFAAHCEAIPRDRLPAMVGIQRLRDAVLAREVLMALEETGGPVAVITGNGHARRDWGIPVYLDRVRPGLAVFALGQSENGGIDGVFDAVLDSPPVERDDPCLAFTRSN
ncbi:ChaN family lipoprotein [Sedimentitalea arenosa]|jgi:uncharacterized iron-regulated protein|uniref:ChaN family lipoprotein n=1 Tax=Sedimentitalea arenosa TaxID=2798803 RepID=A0A8J7J915_9RHOB|nr:ChaN family lipoprotein [Arenibacterium arenosum]MBJ6371198.1 ChaN family lipoprotein [Arenibacterium arenosum]